MLSIVGRLLRAASAAAAGLAILFAAATRTPAETPSAAADRLHRLFADEWEYGLREHPETATSLGDKRYNDRWHDASLEAIRRRCEHDRQVLRELDGIDVAALSESDRLSYRIFRDRYRRDVEEAEYQPWRLALTQLGGVQSVNELADAIVFSAVKDYEDWIARLRRLPALVDQNIALLREGARTGMTYPKVVMSRVPAQIDRQIVGDPATSPFFRPFTRWPPSVGEADRRRLVGEATAAIAEHVVPAYRRLRAFFADEYLPACGDEVGASHWPNGRAYYAFRARRSTTTNLTPDEIHAIGLREVERIEGEMRGILRELRFDGSLQQFNEHLRADPKNRFATGDELLMSYRALCKQIEPRLVQMFGRLPRMPYGVEPIPEVTAADAPAGYYRGPAADGTRAGFFMVNTYKPETRYRHEMVALTLHEAVPGHHLEIALAQELAGLPPFRRYGGYMAYSEGWALYAERLGYELDIYTDAYSRYGQLTYEMWRAVRLVVDTGLHAKGWTRKQAIDYCLDKLAKSELDLTNEVDRYIVWPGQALAYKIGELKIRELRRRAEQALSERFDLRAFHDTVLGQGSVPLDVLESVVDEWIAATRRAAGPTRLDSPR